MIKSVKETKAAVKAQYQRRARKSSDADTKRRHAAVQQEDEPYVLIIRNVENDFAKVHQSSLPSYCCLDPKRYKYAKQVNLASQPDRTAVDVNCDTESVCTYTVKCRTETRSAEILVFGTRDSDERQIFASRNMAQSNVTRHSNNNTENVESSPSTPSKRFSSLNEMVGVMRHRPYFAYPPRFYVYSSANPSSMKAHKELTSSGDKISDANSVTCDEGTGLGHKRLRDSKQDDKVKSSDVGEHSRLDSQRCRTNQTQNNQEENSAHATTDKDSDVIRTDAVTPTDTSVSLSQHRVSQLNLTSALMSLPVKLSVKELRRRLSDLPGLMSCWNVSARLYRVVFVDKSSLLKAKQLLDQFALDGNVRALLRIPQSVMRGHDDYMNEYQENL